MPAVIVSRRPEFQLHWLWYLSVTSVYLQLGLALWLLRREMRKRLVFAVAPSAT